MDIGIIGAGAIAKYLLDEQIDHPYKVKSVLVRDKDKYKSLEQEYEIKIYTDLKQFLQSSIDLVVEAANIEAVKQYLPLTIAQKDTIIISIGALTDGEFLEKVKGIAKNNKTFVHLPSGAIGGLDLIQNVAATGKLKKISLETRKPAHTLLDEKITENKVVFEGSAMKAIEQFPKSINVSIALSLAGIGLKETKVRIIADPLVKTNIHKIFVEGEFGQATFQINNQSMSTNPKTSYLAAMSIIGSLNRLNGQIKIGN